MRCFVLFLATFISKHGVSIVIKSIDSIKDGIFENVLNNWISEATRFSGVDKKRMIVALVQLLCESQEMLTKYESKWSVIFGTVFELLECPEEALTEDEGDNIDNYDYTNVHAQLINAIKPQEDPCPKIVPKSFFATSLHTLSRKMPGQLKDRISKILKPEQFKKLGEYFVSANIQQPYLA